MNDWVRTVPVHQYWPAPQQLSVIGTSLGVQWLRICLAMQGTFMGLIPGWGTKIPHASEQLSLQALEQQKILRDTVKIPHATTKTQHSQTDKCF